MLLAKAPKKILHLEEFDPSGLEETYVDEATGAELPVFAIFKLEGNHRVSFEITTDSVPAGDDANALLKHIPFKKAQGFVKKMNARRIKAQVFAILSVALGMMAGPACFFTHATDVTGALAPLVVVAASACGGLLGYILSVSILDWLCPWQKLVITAEFDGILPRRTRKIACAAKNLCHNLYLVVDQQDRWESTVLPEPSAQALDPLLIGELKQDNQRKWFVLDQFELTAAVQYLVNEFATTRE